MRLVMTLLVRDEIDVIAANLDFHYAQGVDFVIATDNLSVDGTADILQNYEARGRLHYIRETDDDYAQHHWVTRMARMAATDHGADWVINNDADEFWWPEAGDLKQALASLGPGAPAASAERSNFVPREIPPDAFFAGAMTIRERRSLNALGQPLPPKVCHRAHPEIEIGQGNHVAALGGVMLEPVPAPVTIFHFPMRSYRQFESKISKGGAAYSRNTQLPQEIGATWRRLHAVWQAGGLPAHFARQLMGDDEIARGLADGSLIADTRLRDLLASLAGAPPQAARALG